MRCEEIMKRDVKCLGPSDTVQTAALIMRDANVGFLPVCDEAGKVIGALTDRDIAIRADAENLSSASTRATDVMTKEVVACRPRDDVRTAEKLMGEKKKSRMLCIDDAGELCGVISLSDIADRDQRNAAKTMREVSAREACP